MGKTVLIASGKGGSGKTLASVNFSLALNYLNHNVLLIDGNIKKPNVGHHFDMQHHKNMHSVLRRKNHPKEIIRKHPSGLSVVLGGHSIHDLDNIDFKEFRNLLSYLKKRTHDYIVIDSASNFSEEFFHTASFSDETIVITHPHHIDLIEAKKTIQLCDDEGASVIGIIVNGYKNSKVDTQAIENYLKRPILGLMPHEKRVEKTIKMGHPILCSYPNSNLTKSFMDMSRKYSNLK